MYVTVVPNRRSKPAVLLRESYREEGKVRNRTLANLSDWPAEKVEALQAVLKGVSATVGPEPVVEASKPMAMWRPFWGAARSLGLERMLSGKRSRERDLAMALICGRLLSPFGKLALAQGLMPEAASHTLAEELGVAGATEDELYGAMDWLLARQEQIEAKLAKAHLSEGCTVLYDLSSSYFEGGCCPLAKYGYSRDHHGDRLQVEYGLLCNGEGIPVAIEVVEGNTGDPETIPAQVNKLKKRFNLQRVVVVGDRGMLTTTQIRGAIQPSLFDEQGIAEIEHPSFPGERLVVCLNPCLKAKREKDREHLLQLTEQKLAQVDAAYRRKTRPILGRDQVGLAAGRVVNGYGMAKYFRLHVGDHSLRYARRQEILERESATDGIYVIRTSEAKESLSAEQTVLAYKGLAKVERAFRCLKGVDLQVRPIYHRLEERVKAHLFLCMLAYYLEMHLRKAWKTLLFHDEVGGTRSTPVAPIEASPSAQQKKRSPRANPGLPLQSFHGLLQSLSALTRSSIRLGSATFIRYSQPTPLQAEAFRCLGLKTP